MHRIVNCTVQLTLNKIHLFGNSVSVLTMEFLLNWSIIDEVTTRNTTAYFLAQSVCYHVAYDVFAEVFTQMGHCGE